MRIIPPLEITDERLVANNAPPSPEPEYDDQETYTRGDRVQVADTGRIYELAVEEATGIYPPDNLKPMPDGSPQPWFDAGTINPKAMFDGRLGTVTQSDEAWPEGSGNGLQFEIEPGRVVNGLVLFGVVGTLVQVEMIDPIEGLVYDRTISMTSKAGINNWWAWLFSPIERNTDAVFLDMPSYGTAKVRISVQSTSASPASVALAVIGQVRRLGRGQWGTRAGLRNYSRISTNEFGITSFVRRPAARRALFSVMVDKQQVNGVFRILRRYDADPVVWIGDELTEDALIYGVYIDHDIIHPHYAFNELSIEIRGLTQ